MDNNGMNVTLRDLIGEEYLDYNISISEKWGYENVVNIDLENSDGKRKRIYYSVEVGNERPLSNLADDTFVMKGKDHNNGDYSMFYSHIINGKIRSFYGFINVKLGIVYPVWFDLNNRIFVRLPINKSGLINDDGVKRTLEKETAAIGFHPMEYQEALNYHSVSMVLGKLILQNFNPRTFDELAEDLNNRLLNHNMSAMYEVRGMLKAKQKERGRR